ncbi:MAG: hypothetical protein JJU11_16635, partial [Candidatus Sumerlaeia bacterium]|nr:hypothetical protein [Candidatus Sumerlaeia bacterium]
MLMFWPVLFLAMAGPLRAETNEPLLQGIRSHVAVKGSSTVGFTIRDLPGEVTSLEWRVRFTTPLASTPSIRPSGVTPVNSLVFLEPVEGQADTYDARVEFSSPITATPPAEFARITYNVEARLPDRARVIVTHGNTIDVEGTRHGVQGESSSLSVVMVTNTTTLFTLFAGVVGFVYWLSTLNFTQRFFRFFPPLIWMYFIPMTMTT